MECCLLISRADYRMMAVTNPGLYRRTAWRYPVVTMVMSLLAPWIGVASMWFAVETFSFSTNSFTYNYVISYNKEKEMNKTTIPNPKLERVSECLNCEKLWEQLSNATLLSCTIYMKNGASSRV